MAKSYKCCKLHDAIKSMGTVSEQTEAVASVLKLPSIKEVSRKVGFKLPCTVKAAVYNQRQLKRAVKQASKTSRTRGCSNHDQALFVTACMTGMADSPPDSPDQKKKFKIPSLHARAKTTGLPMSTAMRKFKQEKEKRQQLKNLNTELCWSLIKKKRIQKNYS